MRIQLTPSFELSNENVGSGCAYPVLINLQSGEIYGPGDIIKACPGWPFQLARLAVKRMTRNKKLSLNERLVVNDFINFGQ